MADLSWKDMGVRREARSCVVNARFSPSEIAAVSKAATAAGVTVSAFIRSLSMEGAGVEPFLNEDDRIVFDRLREEVRRVGVNLNGLLRSVHRGIIREPEIAEDLKELRPVVAALMIELGKLGPLGASRHSGIG